MIIEKGVEYHFYYATPNLVVQPGTFQGTPQELAAAIQEQVETYPETFDMGAFIDGDIADRTYTGQYDFEEKTAELEQREPSSCGTTLCIAGYAQLFVDGEINSKVMPRAAELLGLKPGTQLFFASDNAGKAMLSHLADGTYSEDMVYQYAAEDDDED